MEEWEQPGTRVRTVGGRRLSDEEMLSHYAALSARHGGLLHAQYHNAICLIDEQGRLHETCNETLRSAPFGLSATPHSRRDPGFPLDALSVELTTGKYYYDLEDAVWLNEECPEGLGFRGFFQALLNDALWSDNHTPPRPCETAPGAGAAARTSARR
jgi:hypothetical protein